MKGKINIILIIESCNYDTAKPGMSIHPVCYHGKAVCERQGMTSNKEFKEGKEI